MEKKLTANEAMELTNQLIEKEMIRSGRIYKEVSQEFRHKLQEKIEQKNNNQITKYLNNTHQEVTEAKMKSVAQYQKSQKNWDKIDRQIQEHYEDHGQVNPNKKVNSEIIPMDELIDYCNKNNRVCPEPKLWNVLWNMLKNKTQNGNRWDPSLPLILAAWWDTPILMKKLRFLEHIEWANKNGQLQEIANFLTNLSEDQWYHNSD